MRTIFFSVPFFHSFHYFVFEFLAKNHRFPALEFNFFSFFFQLCSKIDAKARRKHTESFEMNKFHWETMWRLETNKLENEEETKKKNGKEKKAALLTNTVC